MPERRCDKCEWWCAGWKKMGAEYWLGQCRAGSPPFIRAVELMIPEEEMCSNAEEICYEAKWPITLNTDWCGEFKEKD